MTELGAGSECLLEVLGANAARRASPSARASRAQAASETVTVRVLSSVSSLATTDAINATRSAEYRTSAGRDGTSDLVSLSVV
jgi:hypothetical protein